MRRQILGVGNEAQSWRDFDGARYATVIGTINQVMWMYQTEEELKRAREAMDPLQTVETLKKYNKLQVERCTSQCILLTLLFV